jgi:hypothetical protein
MSEFVNGDETKDAASDLDQPRHTHESEDGANASTPTAFERWLIEYHNRLAQVVHAEPGCRKDN